MKENFFEKSSKNGASLERWNKDVVGRFLVSLRLVSNSLLGHMMAQILAVTINVISPTTVIISPSQAVNHFCIAASGVGLDDGRKNSAKNFVKVCNGHRVWRMEATLLKKVDKQCEWSVFWPKNLNETFSGSFQRPCKFTI